METIGTYGVLLKIMGIYSKELYKKKAPTEITLDTLTALTNDLDKRLGENNKDILFHNQTSNKLIKAINELCNTARIEKTKENPLSFEITMIGLISAETMKLPEDIKMYVEEILPVYVNIQTKAKEFRDKVYEAGKLFEKYWKI